MISPHAPVLLDEVIEALAPQPGDVIIDATFGAGGYTRAILKAGATVIALDRDPTVQVHADAVATDYPEAFRLVRTPFSGLAVPDGLAGYAARLARDPAHLPEDAREADLDLALARCAAVVAVRRHARPPAPGSSPRPLADVAVLLGSGGVLRHASDDGRAGVLSAVLTDHAGGWKVPREATVVTDTAYLLAAVGLLRESHPQAARALAATVVGGRA